MLLRANRMLSFSFPMTKTQIDLFTGALLKLAQHHDSQVRQLGKQLAVAMDMQDVLTVKETIASLDQMRAFP